MSAGLVICATCRPMKATSSMSAVPSEYQGSSTQSWPQPTRMPASIISGTRVMPRRFGIGVVAALDDDVDQRVRDRRDAGLGDQRQQLRDVVVVHRMHRGQVRAGDAALRGRAAASRRRASRCGATAGRRSRRNACRPSARARRRSRRARCTELRPSSMVRSKCGMPPTTSTPMSSARMRFVARRSASGRSRPAGRRRAAGRDRARRAS